MDDVDLFICGVDEVDFGDVDVFIGMGIVDVEFFR